MPTTASRSRSERLTLAVGRLAILASVVLAPLMLVEGLARLGHEPAPVRRVYDPYAYRIPQPGLVDSFPGRDGERLTVRLNELGMRGPSLGAPVPPDALTLVFFGGSTTENYAYALEDTFPELVGRALGQRLGRPVRVWNAAASGATSAVSLGRLQHQVLDLEPDAVVVMHGINDLLGGFHPGYRADGRHLPRPATAEIRPRSYALDWLRQRRPRWARRAKTRVAGAAEIEDWEDFPARRVFERNVRSMVAIADSRRIPILFLTQPVLYQSPAAPEDVARFDLAANFRQVVALPDVPSLARGMAAFNDTTRALAADGVAVFDLSTRMPRSWELFHDECHYTREGNRQVAEEILPAVAELFDGASDIVPP